VFRIFASLGEFEREVIWERTNAGLASVRRRGQTLGRKKGLSQEAENKSRIAESLYKEGKFTVQEIARQIVISKPTLYTYLRHRGLDINS